MIAFQVNDMTCGHCVGAITRAVEGADPGATLRIDLATHRVQIEPGSADPTTLEEAIRAAGYTPVATEPDGSANAAGPARARGACCCR
ncbi:MAG: heavy-metal-associated domain-containing protein [Burkholderiaceae bacterium]